MGSTSTPEVSVMSWNLHDGASVSQPGCMETCSHTYTYIHTYMTVLSRSMAGGLVGGASYETWGEGDGAEEGWRLLLVPTPVSMGEPASIAAYKPQLAIYTPTRPAAPSRPASSPTRASG